MRHQDPPSVTETLFTSKTHDCSSLEMVKLNDGRYAITRGNVLYEGDPYEASDYQDCLSHFWKLVHATGKPSRHATAG